MKEKIESQVNATLSKDINASRNHAINIMSEMILAYYSRKIMENSDAKVK